MLYLGQAVSFTGSMITYVAIPYQVYVLAGSTFVVGLLGFASLAPLLVTALIGGALADARDRRRLVLAADATLLMLSAVLLVNALLGEAQVWLLFLVAAGMSAAGGLQRPPLDALVRRLVPREELPAASSLEPLRGNVAPIAGPALAGVLIASAGLAATYAVDVASFVVSLVALARMRAVPPPPDAAPPSLARITEGWRAPQTSPPGFFRMTLWSQTISDAVRGRLAGIEQLSYSIGPTLGDVGGGAVAAAHVRADVDRVGRGVLPSSGRWTISALLPRFWRYDAGAGAAEIAARRAPVPPFSA